MKKATILFLPSCFFVFAAGFSAFSDSDPNTAVLNPGTCTGVNNLLICMHPLAGMEELTVEVEWFDPEGREYPDLPFRIDEHNGFAEITAYDLEGAFYGPADAGFVVGIPVPEYMDHEQISGMIYTYGDLLSGKENEDYWDYLDHTFDPEYQLLLNYVPVLGGSEHPIRLGIVEHEALVTDHIEPTLNYIIEEYYPGYFDRNDPGHDHNNDLNNAANDIQKHDRGGLQPLSHGDEFEVRCQMGGPYNMLTDNSCSDPDIIELRSDMEDVLENYLLVYHHNLIGSPTPRLSTKRIWHSSTYNYRLYDSASHSSCDLDDGVRGRYNPLTRRAHTCLEKTLGEPGDTDYPDITSVMNTTRHELFHAIQYDYFSKTSSHWLMHRWITEGTARLADSNPPEIHPRGNRNIRPLDVSLINDFPYDATYFWYDVLQRLNAHIAQYDFEYTGIELLGRLFNEGSRTWEAHAFIKNPYPFIQDSPYSSLRDAHWQWARSAAFEADINPGGNLYGDPCTFNEGVFDHGVHELDRSEDHSIGFNIGTPYAATMVKIKLPPNDEDHYYNISISELTGGEGPRARIYTEDTALDPATGDCREFGTSTMFAEHHPDANAWKEGDVGTLYLRAGEESRYAYVLVAAGNEHPFVDQDPPLTPGNGDVDGEQQHRLYVSGPFYDKDIFPTAENFEITLPNVANAEIFTIDPVGEGYAQGQSPWIVTPDYTIQCTDDFMTEHDNCFFSNVDGSAINFALFNTGWFSLPDGSPEVFPYEIIDERDLTASGEITVHRDRTPTIRDRSFLFSESDIEDGNTVTLDVLTNDFSPDPAADITIDDVTMPDCGDVQIAGDNIEFTFANPEECLEDDVYWWLVDDFFFQDEFHYTASTEHGEGEARVSVGGRPTESPPDLSRIEEEMAGFDPVLCGFSPNFGGESLFIGPDAENRLQSRVMTPGATDPVTLAMPGGTSTVMEDINPNGQAAGWAITGERQLMPVMSHRGQAVSPLNIPHGYQGRAHAINQSGIAVGQVMSRFGDARAAMWIDGRMAELQSTHDTATRTKGIRTSGGESRSGSLEDIRIPPTASMAVSINEEGRVLGMRFETKMELVKVDVGKADTGADPYGGEVSGTGAGFGNMPAYTPLPPEQSPDVCHDMVPGGMPSPSLTDGTMGGVEGLIWERAPEGQVTRPIENQFGGGSTFPLDMNDHGQVVGKADISGRDELTTAFLWEDGSMTEIGVLEGAQSGRATAINNQGIAVGTSVMDGELSRGFVWTEETGIQDLNDVLEAGRARKTAKAKARVTGTTGSAERSGSTAGARNVMDASGLTIISAADISETGFVTAYAIDNERTFHVVGISLGEVFREVGAGDGAPEMADLPERFELHQNYPNPFNQATRIRFNLPKETDVLLEVYNILGQRIATLVDERRQPGSHEVTFGFEGISSGTYIYRLEAGDFRKTRKMLLVK